MEDRAGVKLWQAVCGLELPELWGEVGIPQEFLEGFVCCEIAVVGRMNATGLQEPSKSILRMAKMGFKKSNQEGAVDGMRTVTLFEASQNGVGLAILAELVVLHFESEGSMLSVRECHGKGHVPWRGAGKPPAGASFADALRGSGRERGFWFLETNRIQWKKIR